MLFHNFFISSQSNWDSNPYKTNLQNRPMNTSALINFLNVLEKNGILNFNANQKIQQFLDYNNKSIGKLFLTLAAVIGALFLSAGVFAIISHNWDDFPKHLRGALSFVPSLVALYFYYLAVFKHANSPSWIEGSSLFLMLMIGASIALVAQTYQMDGDFDKFVIVWLVLTLPLFYIAKASGIALIYLGLTLKFLTPDFDFGLFGPSRFELNTNYYYFWIFFLAILPHFYGTLNKSASRQGFRAIYLAWVIGIVFILALPFAVKAGFLWWGLATLMIFYIVGKRYFRNNVSALGRPLQTLTLFHLFFNLLYFSDDLINDFAFRIDAIDTIGTWTGEQLLFYFIGLFAMIASTGVALILKKKEAPLNRYVIFTPFLFIFLYLIYCLKEYWSFDMEWLGFFVLNFYVLGFGISAMILGNKSNNVFYMIYGLFLVCALLWMRYFDMDLAFWFKGLLFMGVGLMFFLIHYLSADEFES